MNLALGLENAAKTYSLQADNSERDAKRDAARFSWHMGRAGVFRQASIDFRTMADLAAKDQNP